MFDKKKREHDDAMFPFHPQKKKKGHKPFPRDLNLLFESRCYSK